MKTKALLSAGATIGLLSVPGVLTTPAIADDLRIENATVAQVLAAQNAGTTCRTIATQIQARIAAVNGSLKAFITVNPRLLEDADRLDAMRTRGEIGALHCVPIAVKDNIGTTDMRTTGGSVVFAEMRPDRNATVVTRLLAASAIVVGKTNLDELAVAGSTISSLGGQTLNPYDVTRFAAGSSGGSAVAVSTGMAVAAIGTETVNSIRNAASSAGVVGIRSTRGFVSRDGVIPLSTTMDVVGTFGRSVADASAVLDAIIGRDPADLDTTATEMLPPGRLSPVQPSELRGKRIGVLRNLFGTGSEHQAVNAVVESALDRLRQAGVEIVEIADGSFDSEASARALNVNNYEFAPLFERYLAELGSAAPIKTIKEYAAVGKYPATMKGYIANALAWKAPLQQPAYFNALGDISATRVKLMHLMESKRLDALAYPMQKRPPLKLSDAPRPERNGIFASALGWPAIDIPAGFTPPTDSARIGLPIGLDLMTGPYRDRDLLSLAAAVEATLVGRRAPPM